jgi:hypothetical protein
VCFAVQATSIILSITITDTDGLDTASAELRLKIYSYFGLANKKSQSEDRRCGGTYYNVKYRSRLLALLPSILHGVRRDQSLRLSGRRSDVRTGH